MVEVGFNNHREKDLLINNDGYKALCIFVIQQINVH